MVYENLKFGDAVYAPAEGNILVQYAPAAVKDSTI
jgi:hypothetical protein